MTDTELMQSIKEKYGAAIAAACTTSSVRPGFLAALVANESGGDPDAKRFEPHVLSALWEVLLGRKAAYGSIGTASLVAFIAAGAPGAAFASVQTPQSLPADAFHRLDALATSWGVTQVMGYEICAFAAPGFTADQMHGFITDVAQNLRYATMMLAQFAHRWNLSLADPGDAGELFDCWNTGRPHKLGADASVPQPTADPQYIPNGIARMKLYEALT